MLSKRDIYVFSRRASARYCTTGHRANLKPRRLVTLASAIPPNPFTIMGLPYRKPYSINQSSEHHAQETLHKQVSALYDLLYR